MSGAIQGLIERYGLIAVFLGCMAEGETSAILAGFFGHQHVFVPWMAFGAAFSGAFLGDTLLFLAGRLFAGHPRIVRLRQTAVFDRAFDLVQRHPNLFVLGNRYVYGLRLAGGVAAGLSTIPVPRFLVLNLIACALWSSMFCGLGYVLGAGAEQVLGHELRAHERLLVALGLGVAALVVGHFVFRRLRRSGAQ